MSGLLAQQAAADETGRTVTLIIFGLLIVAALLAGLTVWYWRFTDPKKRLRSPVREPIGALDDHAASDQTAPTAGRTAVAPPAESLAFDSSSAIEAQTNEALEDDGADDWLRLTGPQATRRGR